MIVVNILILSHTMMEWDQLYTDFVNLKTLSNSLVNHYLNDPNNVEVLTNKGSALGKLGYFNEAIIHYDKAIEINSNFLPALNNKANILASMGNYDEAISLYAEVLGKNPRLYLQLNKILNYVFSEMPQKNNGQIFKIQISLH